MKLCVVALDYDGTIARDGRVEPLVIEAVKEAQARGIVVILVTGRIMADLRRVLPKPELFDAVVSENGAVLSFPNVPSRLLTHPPSQIVLDELCALQVQVDFAIASSKRMLAPHRKSWKRSGSSNCLSSFNSTMAASWSCRRG
jgi:hydroxymethylpyrimidine pyrophosphatase-like HAD family hydrolase